MKKQIILIPFLLLFFCLTSCQKNENYPKLKISNLTSATIISVTLDGYSFSDLNIGTNETREFNLKDGMENGYFDIAVEIRMSKSNLLLTKQCNFEDGKTTVLNVNGLENSRIAVTYE